MEDDVHVEAVIAGDDPLSAHRRFSARTELLRESALEARVETECHMRSDHANFYVTSEQRVFDHGEEFHVSRREFTIPRDLV